ncbi:hypothetical protein [Aliarcobacter butzleri]|uniref:hypothetical protein n=1 Tax=Aliarcobacter butzleri TaxID=28197 RepID=UPI0021B38738|nr:hypothetical protein [Aliarcobacter butzleri]MCT7536978.1 hypothetical protein [Aliarcobacter butzleri]MCT7623458.1 hypothetical protein [Aliarcobacter butzleri]
MLKSTYKDIAALIDKSEASIKNYKAAQPQLLEILQLGATAKLNNISLEELESYLLLKETILNSLKTKEES